MNTTALCLPSKRSVRDFQSGDRVIATVKDECFCSSVRPTAYVVLKIPDDVPFEVAATFPISYSLHIGQPSKL